MTIEEKLKHFEDVCTKSAQDKYNAIIFDYKADQEKLFSEHKDRAKRETSLRVQAEAEKLRRDMNRQLSVSQIEIKRAYGRKQEELKGKIFSELRNRLAQFMETPAYWQLLQKQILAAREFAGTEELHIYLDPADETQLKSLSMATGCEIRLSQYPFIGGCRCVIASKNILIDNSFETKLKEAEETFQFVLGGK